MLRRCKRVIAPTVIEFFNAERRSRATNRHFMSVPSSPRARMCGGPLHLIHALGDLKVHTPSAQTSTIVRSTGF